jgi:hypothetical protein
LVTAVVADAAFGGSASAATELRQREKIMGTTLDSRRDLRIRYVSDTPAEAVVSSPVSDLDERRRRLTSA